MEKTKNGLSLVAIVLAIVLLGGVVGYVVYAAISQTFNFGGNVSFVADGVEATIKATDWEGCTIGGEEYSSGQSILQTITYSTDKDSDSSETVKNSWSNLTIVVTDSTDGTATITFSVSNNFTDDTTISVTIGEISNDSDDLTIEVDPDYATISAGKSEEFVITFTLDANYTLDSATFSIPITLAIVETYSVSFNDVDVSRWSCDYEKTIDVAAAYSISGNDGSWIEFAGTGNTIKVNVLSTIYFQGCMTDGVGYFYYLEITDGNNTWTTANTATQKSQTIEIDISEEIELTITSKSMPSITF